MKRLLCVVIIGLLLLLFASPALAEDNPPVAPPLQSQQQTPQQPQQPADQQAPAQTQQQPAQQQSPLAQESAPAQNVTEQPGQSAQFNPRVPDISAGLPSVTTEQFVGKAQRIAGNVYGAAAGVIPYVALGVLVAGAVLGIFFKAARSLIWVAVLALAVVLFAPQIVGYVLTLIKS